MDLSIEKLKEIETYYLPDEDLHSEYFEFLVANSKFLRIPFSRAEYEISDYYPFYAICEEIAIEDSKEQSSPHIFLFSSRKRCIRYSTRTYSKNNEYLYLDNELFNYQSDVTNHSIRIGEYIFKIHKPFEYNFLIILIKLSNKNRIDEKQPEAPPFILTPLVISKQIQEKYGLMVDIDSVTGIAISRCMLNLFDKNAIELKLPYDGGICLYNKSWPKGEIKPISSIVGDPYISMFESPISKECGSYPSYGQRILRTERLFNAGKDEDLKLFGNEENLVLYVFGYSKDIGIKMKFFSESDYYKAASWLVVAFAYRLKREKKIQTIHSYWPDCPLFDSDITLRWL